MKLKTALIFAILIIIPVPTSSAVPTDNAKVGDRAGTIEGRQFSLESHLTDGTPVSATIVASGSDEERAGEALSRAITRTLTLDRELFAAGGQASQMSSLQKGEVLKLSPDIYRMIERATELAALTNGWFDITAPSPKHWFTKRDWRRIILDRAAKSMTFKSDGMKLDLKKFELGFIADLMIEEIGKAGFTDVSVDIGRAVHRNSGHDIFTPWTIEVEIGGEGTERLARRANRYAVSNIAAASVTHSGLGADLTDPLNKKTVPVQAIRSLTILAADASAAVAYALAAYTIGPKYAMPFVERHPEIKAIMVDNLGNIFASSGLIKELRESPLPIVTIDKGPNDLHQKRREEAMEQ